jgi:hypothetical protein
MLKELLEIKVVSGKLITKGKRVRIIILNSNK